MPSALSACGGGDSGGAAESAGGGAISRNADNAKTTLTIGSKNFTEQQVLGEIYAQGLRAAGYNVKTELNLGDEKIALQGAQGRRDRRLPGVHRHGAAVVLRQESRRDLPKDPQAAYEEAKAEFAAEGMIAFPPTPFTVVQRGRGDAARRPTSSG